MKTSITRLCSCALVLLTTGCSSLRSTWDYQTTTVKASTKMPAPPPTREAARAACKTPLRVAVGDGSSDHRTIGDHGVGGSIGWAFGGLIMSLPLGTIKEEALDFSSMPWKKIYEIALYSELVDTECFAAVAYKPKELGSYDLVFHVDIQRYGTHKSFPFVPLPIFLGTSLSLAFSSHTVLNEWDIVATRADGTHVFTFATDASCKGTDCIELSEASYARELREQLRRGYTNFDDQLYGWIASRSPAYWNEVHARTRERYFHSLDPELAKLEAQKADPAEIAKRRELLETFWRIEVTAEDAWASTSRDRVQKIVHDANVQADAEYKAALQKAVVMAATGAVVLGRQIQSGQVQPTYMMEVNAKTAALMKDVEKVEAFVELAKSVVNPKDRPPGDPTLAILAAIEGGKGDAATRLLQAKQKYPEMAKMAAVSKLTSAAGLPPSVADGSAVPSVVPAAPAAPAAPEPPVKPKPAKPGKKKKPATATTNQPGY